MDCGRKRTQGTHRNNSFSRWSFELFGENSLETAIAQTQTPKASFIPAQGNAP